MVQQRISRFLSKPHTSNLRAFSLFCGVFRASGKEARSTIPRSRGPDVETCRSARVLGGYPRPQHFVEGGFMLEIDEDEAQATRRIVDKETGKTVGLLYVWEDGYEQPLWLDGARKDVALCELTDSPQQKTA